MNIEDFLAALTASGMTLETLTAMLAHNLILVQIESAKAAVARKQAERQDAINVFDGELRELRAAQAALEAQANISL